MSEPGRAISANSSGAVNRVRSEKRVASSEVAGPSNAPADQTGDGERNHCVMQAPRSSHGSGEGLNLFEKRDAALSGNSEKN